MARCEPCGRPAGFGRQRCAWCAGGGRAAELAAATPFVVLTVPGVVGAGDRARPFELRVTSVGLELEMVAGGRLGGGIGEDGETWQEPYDRISRVVWDPGRSGWGLVVWRDGQVARMVEGLDPDVAPAAERLLARRLGVLGR